MTLPNRLARIVGSGGSRKVTAQQAHDLQQDGAVLLDVRTREEFEAGHAPKARNVPLDQPPEAPRSTRR